MIDKILEGLWTTLQVSTLAFLGAVILGVLLAAARVSPISPLRMAATAYVAFGRNVPVLALLFLVVYGLPEVGITFPLFTASVLVLAAYEGAFAAEAFRTGINTVDVGSAQAARALGMTNGQALRFVVLPQAWRNVIQPIANVLIKTVLASSLVTVVGIQDLTGTVERLSIDQPGIGLFLFAGVIYVSIALGCGGFAGWLERRVRISG